MGKLQFILGPSGSGKSTKVYQDILELAVEYPERNFLVVVPDQYTMQTQKQLVSMSPRGGILNIDVLSFGRLTHRILEEVGTEGLPVLDDTGKCLVLQKVASDLTDQMPVLGKRLHRQGYIQEAKSAISEFKQYGISPEGMEVLIENGKKQPSLMAKLRDLQILYKGFQDYLAGNFITTEEKLQLLMQAIPCSEILPDSYIIFDGFTGFTPIQLQVIGELLPIAGKVVVTLALGEETSITEISGEQELFYLSKKTYRDLTRLAGDYPGVEMQEPVYVTGSYRLPMLSVLEKRLFRYESGSCDMEEDSIVLSKMSNPAAEVHQAGREILRLVREEGLEYRQIAMVSGDLATYAPYVEREFASMGIPCYIDQTRGIRLNPVVEAIRSAIKIQLENYSQSTVFHFLRSGLGPLSPDEVDVLEEYVKHTGVRGITKWNQSFARKTREMKEQEAPLALVNELRERTMAVLEILQGSKRDTVAGFVNRLYDFLLAVRAQERLTEYAEAFGTEGDPVHQKEYTQIYRYIMELLDQIVSLLGDEEISLQEFYEILDAGFGEIRVGTIPQSVDRVPVGDMERTRLQSVKVLFFLGVNDGNIPGSAGTGGLLSDMDRELLAESGVELAPTPRQQMYTQRLYLYLNMTKPTERLYLSYSVSDVQGKTLRASYLIEVLKAMFPCLSEKVPEKDTMLSQIVTPKEGYRYLARTLAEYVEKPAPSQEERTQLCTLLSTYLKRGKEEAAYVFQLLEAAFYRYDPELLPEAVIPGLYGEKGLYCSVSQLETYGKCAYQYYLRYGLSLQEENPFEVRPVDTGNIYHGVLKEFSDGLKNAGFTWSTFTESYAKQAVHKALEEQTVVYGSAVYYDTARNANKLRAMENVLLLSVAMLQKHVRNGSFLPMGSEIPFWQEFEGSAEDKRIVLHGKIDRVDVGRRGDNSLLVEVIDYKSGDNSLDFAKLYHGQQLQLPLYMGQELRYLQEKEKAPVLPAGMLYYHLTNPVLKAYGEETPDGQEQLEEQLQAQREELLKMKGLVSTEPDILGMLCENLKGMPGGANSHIQGLKLLKDGGLGKTAPVLSPQEFELVISHARHMAKTRGEEILSGHMEIAPTEENCGFCPYKGACGFDVTLPGYETFTPEKLSREEVLERMAQEEDT